MGSSARIAGFRGQWKKSKTEKGPAYSAKGGPKKRTSANRFEGHKEKPLRLKRDRVGQGEKMFRVASCRRKKETKKNLGGGANRNTKGKREMSTWYHSGKKNLT